MEGYLIACPKCGNKQTQWLATYNQWEGYCDKCDIRFNSKGILHPQHLSTEVLDGNIS